MDSISRLLAEHHAADTFVLRCRMRAPWSMRIADGSALAVVVLVRGTAAITLGDGSTTTLRPGDVALVKGETPYLVADTAARAPSVEIGPAQICRTLEPAEPAEPTETQEAPAPMVFGVRPTRFWGNDPDGPTELLVGAYELPGQVSARLLRALPDLAALPGPACDVALLHLLNAELDRDLPGQSAVLDRLVDLVLVSCVRAWFAREGASVPAWWVAQHDPVVGPVLGLMHDQPDQPWSVESLAAQVGYGRASVARRFAEIVGQPPMTYLTEWRMAMAADLLASTTLTVEAVGRRVGYANPFAFSTAFKRAHGRSPRAFRSAA